MRPKDSGGFTTLELIINGAIVAILIAIALPAYMAFRDRAKIAQAKADLYDIQLAVEQLIKDTGKRPGPEDAHATANEKVWDLNAANAGLVQSNGKFPKWRGPYIQSVPKDPWGSDYFFDPGYYIKKTKHAAVGSFGPHRCCRNAYDSNHVILLMPTN